MKSAFILTGSLLTLLAASPLLVQDRGDRIDERLDNRGDALTNAWISVANVSTNVSTNAPIGSKRTGMTKPPRIWTARATVARTGWIAKATAWRIGLTGAATASTITSIVGTVATADP